jgi:hypothetical protein
MLQPNPIDDRIRTWTIQRELVRASLASTARGHILSPTPGRTGAAPFQTPTRPRKRA